MGDSERQNGSCPVDRGFSEEARGEERTDGVT